MAKTFPLKSLQRQESPSLASWQQTGKWFSYAGHAIFSRMAGEGEEALLLIHGFPTASWDWHALWPNLVPHFRVLALDMLGFGLSDKPADYPYSLVDQASLHQGWLESLGVRRVHIMAHDYGCSVAQELMAREQEGELQFEIGSASFLNGALFPEIHRPILIQKLLLSPLGGLVSRVVTRPVFEYNLRRIFGPERPPTEEELEDFWQLLIYNNGRGVVHRLIGYIEERRCHRDRWVGALQRARHPLQLIAGQVDPISGRALADRFETLCPGADLHRLRRVGHYPHVEAPEQVWDCYRRFRGY